MGDVREGRVGDVGQGRINTVYNRLINNRLIPRYIEDRQRYVPTKHRRLTKILALLIENWLLLNQEVP